MRSNKFGVIAALVLAVTFAFAGAAIAAVAPAATDDTKFTLPYGDYLASAILAVGGMAYAIVGHVIGLLPGPAQFGVKVLKLDQVIGKAISTAAFDLAEDIQKKSWTVDVRNAMLAETLRNVEANARDLYAKYRDTIALKAKARIEEYIASKMAKSA